MNKVVCFFVLTSFAAALEPSGRIQFNWDKLGTRAVEKVDITLEGPVLAIATMFLSDKGDESKIKNMVRSLKGIYVKSYTFDKVGQYSEADVNEIRAQVKAPEWSKIVDTQEKNASAAIYLKTDGKQTQGIVILSAEPKELTLVQIIGPIDPSMLNELSGNLGIPKIDLGSKQKTTTGKKDD
jgi:hypothetical protein